MDSYPSIQAAHIALADLRVSGSLTDARRARRALIKAIRHLPNRAVLYADFSDAVALVGIAFHSGGDAVPYLEQATSVLDEVARSVKAS